MTVLLFSLASLLILVVPVVWLVAVAIDCCIDGSSYDEAVDDVQAFIRDRETLQKARRSLWPHGAA